MQRKLVLSVVVVLAPLVGCSSPDRYGTGSPSGGSTSSGGITDTGGSGGSGDGGSGGSGGATTQGSSGGSGGTSTVGAGGNSEGGAGGNTTGGAGGSNSGGATARGGSGGSGCNTSGGAGGNATGGSGGTTTSSTTARGGSGGSGGAGGGSGGSGGSSSGGTTASGGSVGSGGASGTATGGNTGSGGTTSTGGTTGPIGPTGPCDIYASAGTPCAAAHATVRTLYAAYPGPLYQVQRASDKATKDIMVGDGGFADMAAQDSFCSGTTCTIPIIYDQSGNGNHLRVTWWAYWLRNGGKPANAKGQVIKVGGHSVTGIVQTAFNLDVGYRTGEKLAGKASVSKGSTTVTFTSPQTLPANTPLFFAANTADCPEDSFPDRCFFKAFRTAADITNATTVTLKNAYDGTASSSTDVWNHATKGMPTGDDSQAEYMVVDAKRSSQYCCFGYGNAELSGWDEGNATMEVCHFGSITQFGQSGGGSGPWVGADLENGIFEGYENGSAKVSSNTSITGMDYLTAMVKGPGAKDCPSNLQSTGCFGLKAGNAQSGSLQWKFSSSNKAYGQRPPGYSPKKLQGAIILATGGDGSNGGTGTWFEGAITKGLPSDATDDAVQANIVAVGYGR
jgi:hypothetical protein